MRQRKQNKRWIVTNLGLTEEVLEARICAELVLAAGCTAVFVG